MKYTEPENNWSIDFLPAIDNLNYLGGTLLFKVGNEQVRIRFSIERKEGNPKKLIRSFDYRIQKF